MVALVYGGRLYVANVGDSRALLCKTDDNQVLRVIQLSVDHDLRNEDELLRLSHLGLDTDSIRQGAFIINTADTYVKTIYFYTYYNKSVSEKLLRAVNDI